MIEEKVSCPECGSYEVEQNTRTDEYGQCEYRCKDCGHYFVDDAPEGAFDEADRIYR